MKKFTKFITLFLSIVMICSSVLLTACQNENKPEDKTTLSSIAVTTQPKKTAYEEGEVFDATGMVVTATYSNGKTADVTRNAQYSPTGKLAASDTTINISYRDGSVTKTTTLAITVKALPVPTSIAITTQPTLSYVEGEKFNPAGMVVTATYDSGSTGVLTAEEYSYDLTYDLAFEDSGKKVKVSYINPISGLETQVSAQTDALTVTRNDKIKTNLTLDKTTSATYRSEHTIEAEDFTIKDHSKCEFDEEGKETKCYFIADETWANIGTATSGKAVYKLNNSANVLWCRIDSAVAVENVSLSLYMSTVDFDDFDSNVLTRWNGKEIITGFKVNTGGYSAWKEFIISDLSLNEGLNTLTLSLKKYCANLDKVVLTLNPGAELDPAANKPTALTVSTGDKWTGEFTERTKLSKSDLLAAGLTVQATFTDGTTKDVTNEQDLAVSVNASNYFLLQDKAIVVSYTANGAVITKPIPVTVKANADLVPKEGWKINSASGSVKIEAEDTYVWSKRIGTPSSGNPSGGKKIGDISSSDSPVYIKLKSNVTTDAPVKISMKICLSAASAYTFDDKVYMFFQGERILTGLKIKATGWNDYTSVYEFEIGSFTLTKDEIYTFTFSVNGTGAGNIDWFEFVIGDTAAAE